MVNQLVHIILGVVVVVIVVFVLFVLWWSRGTAAREKNWSDTIKQFVQENDGKRIESAVHRDDPLLLIVCPASGRGKAMDMFPGCVQLLSERGFAIEVYVTKDGTDIETLSERKDLGAYKVIAILAGDSSIFQLIQVPLQKSGGRWPYAAPILHLPGGTGNVISGEFHKWAHYTEIIPNISLDKVVKGTVIKVSSPGVAPVYAVHNTFDGLQRLLLERFNNDRSFAIFGMAGVFVLFLQTLWRVDRNMKPFYLSVVNSDVEGMGNNFGFGVCRTDDKLVLVQVNDYKSFPAAFVAASETISGKTADKYFKNKLPDHITVKIGKKFTFSGHNYRFACDGHTDSLCLEGNLVTIESIPYAIPYMYI